MNKLRVAVAGVGYLGKFHAEKYAARDDVSLVGVVDTDKQAAQKIADKCRTQAFFDYKDLLGKVDAVSVAVPTPHHFAIARDFLENNADVLIEKPITTTLEQADALIELARQKNLIIQAGHLERFNPAVKALDEIVKNPIFFEAQRLSTFKPRALSVSVVLDLMIHDIDIILNLAGSKLKNLYSTGISVVSDHLDAANVRLEFENGCVASITASRMESEDRRTMRIFQKNASVTVDFANRKVAVMSLDKNGNNEPGMKTDETVFESADALAEEIENFVHCVIKRETPKVSGQVGRDALAIALAVMAAS